jgi:hypothetical protein
MLDSIVVAFEKLFVEFSWRRILHIVLLFATALSLFLLFEWYTSYFQLQRLSKSTEILARLQEIESKGFISNSELKKIHSQAVKELQASQHDRMIQLGLRATPGPDFLRALFKWAAAASPWWLMALAAWLSLRGKKGGGPQPITAFLIIGLLLGAIGMAIPTFYWPWFNLVIYPVAHFIIIVTLIVFVASKAAK